MGDQKYFFTMVDEPRPQKKKTIYGADRPTYHRTEKTMDEKGSPKKRTRAGNRISSCTICQSHQEDWKAVHAWPKADVQTDELPPTFGWTPNGRMVCLRDSSETRRYLGDTVTVRRHATKPKTVLERFPSLGDVVAVSIHSTFHPLQIANLPWTSLCFIGIVETTRGLAADMEVDVRAEDVFHGENVIKGETYSVPVYAVAVASDSLIRAAACAPPPSGEEAALTDVD